MDNEQLDEIMKCSKEAIARAYMCRSYYEYMKECPAVSPIRCPLNQSCGKITPQDWDKVLVEPKE